MPSSFTYDNTHPDSEDVVKFYLRQTATTAPPRDFDDEEITATLARSTLSTVRAREYGTAADMLTALIVEFASSGKGRDKGEISKLKITFGGRSTKMEILEKLVTKYEMLAAKFSRGKPRAAKLLNASGMRR